MSDYWKDTAEDLSAQLEEMELKNHDIWKRNVELRRINKEINTKVNRLEKMNAQQYKTIQCLMKVINYCEREVNQWLEMNKEENNE